MTPAGCREGASLQGRIDNAVAPRMLVGHMGSERTFAGAVTLGAAAMLGAAAAGCEGEEVAEVALVITPYDLAPGDEVLRCEEMELPSDADLDFDRVSWAFSEGKHHVHVFVSATGEAPRAGPYECTQAIDFEKWSLLVASQGAESEWALPPGVAIHVRARQSILVQTHYLDTGPGPLTARGSVTLHVAAPGSVERRAAAFFGQNRGIDVPPHSSATVTGECALPGRGELLAALGHYHLHGRAFRGWLSRGEAGAREGIYEGGGGELGWATYEGLGFGPSDRLGWSCDLDNDMASPLRFGSHEATEEHCNLFAFVALTDGDAEPSTCVLGE